MSLFLFWGQEEFNIEKEIGKLKDKLLDSSFVSMNYKVLDNPDFPLIIENIRSAPMMFGNTLTVINCEKYLIGAKGTVDDKLIKMFEESLSLVSPNVNIVFLCSISRDENKKIDTRKKLYKILSKFCEVKEFPQYRTYQKELGTEIQKIIKSKELQADAQVINYIIEQLGANLRLIDSEMEKLKIAVHPKKQITVSDIKEICVSCDDIFLLADLIADGNKDKALEQFHSLIERRHYLEILSVLQSSFQRFIFIKHYSSVSSAKEIGEQLHLHEFIVKKTMEKISKLPLEKLVKIKSGLTAAEYKIKTGALTSPLIAIEEVLAV